MTSASTASRRRLLWLAAIVLGLVGAAWAAVIVRPPPARVRAMVQSQLAGALTREVRFRDVGVGLWPPVRITLAGLELAEPGGFANGAAFQVASLHLDLAVVALLTGKVRVRRLVLDRPSLHLVLNPDGTTNFDNLAKPPPPGRKPPKPMDVDLAEVRIERGRALIDALGSQRRVTFQIDSRVALATA